MNEVVSSPGNRIGVMFLAAISLPVTFRPRVHLRRSQRQRTVSLSAVVELALSWTMVWYIATNFLGHGTVNPKANESDD